MSLEFIEYCANWARLFQASASAVEQTVLRDLNKDILAYRIRFASGRKITALSSRPSNLRGKQGLIIIDEAAFHEDLAALLKAAIAVTMWGGAVHIISSHYGADNPFADLVNDIRAARRSYGLHRTTLDDALAQGLYGAICHEAGISWTPRGERDWRADLIHQYGDDADEELFCVPSKGGGVFLPTELIESCMTTGIAVLRARGEHADEELEPLITAALEQFEPYRQTCFGVDFGRSGDLSVFWFLQLGEDTVRHTRLVVELRDVPHEVQRKVLFHALDHCPWLISGVMDAGGNGSWLAEETGRKYGGTREEPERIELLILNLEWYRNEMPKFKRALEEHQLELPRNADILADLRMIRMERGVAKVPDRRTREIGGGQRHGDAAVACALAYYASYRNSASYEYLPVARKVSAREFLQRGGRDQEPDNGRHGLNGTSGAARFRTGSW